jgi:hypothetical protein
MIHNKILKLTIAIADALLAVTVLLLAADQTDVGMEFFCMPFTIMLAGIIAAAYAFDKL